MLYEFINFRRCRTGGSVTRINTRKRISPGASHDDRTARVRSIDWASAGPEVVAIREDVQNHEVMEAVPVPPPPPVIPVGPQNPRLGVPLTSDLDNDDAIPYFFMRRSHSRGRSASSPCPCP